MFLPVLIWGPPSRPSRPFRYGASYRRQLAAPLNPCSRCIVLGNSGPAECVGP